MIASVQRTVRQVSSGHATGRRLGVKLRPLALAMALIGTSAGAQLPTGFNPIQGTVDMPGISGNTMSLRQRSDRALVEWGSFSIGAANAVNIRQPGVNSIMLNRVTGGELSTIAGSLTANGKVFLVNPAGVLFGAGSQVSTGGLVASTLDISNADFAAGRFNFERADGNTASVINLGKLQADGSTIALMAAEVRNEGTVRADGGTIGLISGRKVSLDFQGDGLTTFRLDPATQASAAMIENAAGATLQADGGKVVVLANSTQVAQQVVNQEGTVRARSLSTRNGEIFLGAGEHNDVRLAGVLDASGEVAGTKGGSVVVQAAGISASSASSINASGDGGGGQISLASTRSTLIASGFSARADASVAGNGGEVKVDGGSGGLHLGGELSASAAGNGDGGKIDTRAAIIEVSAAPVAASGAGTGKNGQWTIASQGDLTVGAAPFDRVEGEVSIYFDSSRVSDAALGTALGRATDVIIAATGTPADGARVESGSVRLEANAAVLKSEGRGSSLKVDAKRHITMESGSAIESSASALNVDFNADSSGVAMARADRQEIGGAILLSDASISTKGGDIRFYGRSDPIDGYASGGTAFSNASLSAYVATERSDGIALVNSVLQTCADPGCATGAGSINVAGRGRTVDGSTGLESGVGVALRNSSLRTAGSIAVNGVGGAGAAGVLISSKAPDEAASLAAMGTGSNIVLVGEAGSTTRDDVLLAQPVQAGIEVVGAELSARGDVDLTGTGGDLTSLTSSEMTLKLLGSGTIDASHGLRIADSNIEAGNGGRIALSGQVGSDGVRVGTDGSQTAIPASAVLIEGQSDNGDSYRIRSHGGTIAINGNGGDVHVLGNYNDWTLSTDNAGGKGGSIDLSGRNIGIENALLSSQGSTGGGTITVAAEAAAALGQFSRIQADASAEGDGGIITVTGGQSLRAHGGLSARGAGSGAGGQIETSAGAFDLRGVKVDAGAAGGAAGSWLIDPYNVNIVNGSATGSLPSNIFDPVAASVVQDGDINLALNSGANVSIGTGTTGLSTDGKITIESGVLIQRSTGSNELTLAFNAHRNIEGNDFTIESTGSAGALNLDFNSNANNSQAENGGIALSNAALRTNGGGIRMGGQSNAASGQASALGSPAIALDGVSIDTRVGQSDAGTGGDISLRGSGSAGASDSDGSSISLVNTVMQSSSGNVSLTGIASPGGAGVVMQGDASSTVTTRIETTSGNVSIVGVGDGSAVGGDQSGVQMAGALLSTADGIIDVRGRSQGANPNGSGVVLEDASLVVTGSGRVAVSGESAGSGKGIDMQGGTAGSLYGIDGGGQLVVLRADNNGADDAISLGAPIRSGSTINLRPGGVDGAGNVSDHTATAIGIGGVGSNGFSLSDTDVANLDAPSIVVGSDAHAAAITVEGPVSVANDLTLQTEGGGAIAVDGALSAASLALLAAGDITQSASGSVAANSLLARSAAGSVRLNNPANAVAAIAGSAASDFRYTNANTLSVGTTSAQGLQAASGTTQAINAEGVQADRAIIQTRAGNLSIDEAVNAASAATLQADGGALQVNQALSSSVVGLLAQGDITQASAAPIIADTLLARSNAGNVILVDVSNAVGVLAGGAGGNFRYTNAAGLQVGNTSVNAQDGTGALQTVNAAGVQAASTQVLARTGDLAVNADSSAVSTLSLQALTGNMAINAGLQADTMALVANGAISQSGTAGARANALLARSTTSNVVLNSAANDVRALAGDAAGDFRYGGTGNLAVSTVNASVLNSSGAPLSINAAGIAAEDIVVQTHSGNLTLDAASNAAGGLALQADNGSINLAQQAQAQTIALLASGDIGQTGSGAIGANRLLARSTAGSIVLDGPSNASEVVSGSAANAFRYTNVSALTIGSILAEVHDASGNLGTTSASGIAADASVVRTLSDDLTLDATVSGRTADLVAAQRFQNPGSSAVSTTESWRVWADTWVGESRGGMTGSGPLPNLYNRAHGTASVPDTANHFIYRQQPTVTVTLDSATRPAGQPNPPLGYGLSGLILGDTGAGITGSVGTSATATSPGGTYAVTALTPFTSAEGYAINVVPGQLVVQNLQIPPLDFYHDMPTTYLYDRNIAPVAMCFATGPLAGSRAEQTGDVLSREWARVRSRPNLTNCVSTDRSNACSDF